MKRYNLAQVSELIEVAPEDFLGRCHELSLRLVRTGAFGDAQVARGWAAGVGSQHSWITTGGPYDRSALIIDPTLWTYRDDVDDIWYGSLKDGIHQPHGAGSIWRHGAPPEPTEEIIAVPDEAFDAAELDDDERANVRQFLNLCGPLDLRGWSFLAHAPVEGWPARELYLAAKEIPGLGFRTMVPIDQWAMVTGENTSELYR